MNVKREDNLAQLFSHSNKPVVNPVPESKEKAPEADLAHLIQKTPLIQYLENQDRVHLGQVDRNTRNALEDLGYTKFSTGTLAIGEKTVLRCILHQCFDPTRRARLAKSVRFMWAPECWKELNQLVPELNLETLGRLRKQLIAEPSFAQAVQKYKQIKLADPSLQTQLGNLLPDRLLPPRTIASTPIPWLERTYLGQLPTRGDRCHWLADGRPVFVTHDCVQVYKWDGRDLKIEKEIPIGSGVRDIGRDQIIIRAYNSNTVTVWREQRLKSGEWTSSVLAAHTQNVNRQGELEDGRVVTMGENIRVWRPIHSSGDLHSTKLSISGWRPVDMITISNKIVAAYQPTDRTIYPQYSKIKLWTQSKGEWTATSLRNVESRFGELLPLGRNSFALNHYELARSIIFYRHGGLWSNKEIQGIAVGELPNKAILYHNQSPGVHFPPKKYGSWHPYHNEFKWHMKPMDDNVAILPDGSLITQRGEIWSGSGGRQSLGYDSIKIKVLPNGHLEATDSDAKLWLYAPPATT